MSLDIYNRAYTESDGAMKNEARGDFDGALISYRKCLQWIAADPQRVFGDERSMSETSLRLHQAIKTIEEHAKDRIHALQAVVDEEIVSPPSLPPIGDDSIRMPVFIEPSLMGKSSFERENRARVARTRDTSPNKKMTETLRPQVKTRQSSDQSRILQAQKETHDNGPRTAKAAASNAAMLAWGPPKPTASNPNLHHAYTDSNGSSNGSSRTPTNRPDSANSSHRPSSDRPRYTLSDEQPRREGANGAQTRRVGAPTVVSRNPSPLPPQTAGQRTQQQRVASPVSRPPPVTRATPPSKPPPPAPSASRTPAPRGAAATQPARPITSNRSGPPAKVSAKTTTTTTTTTKAPILAGTSGTAAGAKADSQPSLLSDDKMDRAEEALKNVKGLDATLAKSIINEIVDNGDQVYWEDIAGLEAAKNSLKETVVYPLLRPDLFSGLREPVTGMLLFGPPGTGKTMLARAVATQAKATFFSISASSLTSKYLGESEKLVRALFVLAKELSPSIIFVDEIDSLLSSRGEGEHESSRRLKTEFLIQWSALAKAAAGSKNAMDARVLVLAATNLPWAIDDAARRRFVRRQYIPLPEESTRFQHLNHLIRHQKHTMSLTDVTEITSLTDGFSGSDLTALAKDAAMGPLRSLGDALLTTDFEKIRPMGVEDFKASLRTIRPSVNKAGLEEYTKWDAEFGSN